MLGCHEGKGDKLVVGILQHTLPESCVGVRNGVSYPPPPPPPIVLPASMREGLPGETIESVMHYKV